tara:strand:+ start:15784 stop:16740 length:957 start_codon:yes stop_codon:yes gene_type:complete
MDCSFLNKYKPRKFEDFIVDPSIIAVLSALIDINDLNLILIGPVCCGKSALINAIIYEYYKSDNIPPNNILYINNLSEQGISFYRNEVKTFCQTPSRIYGKKKFIVVDDIEQINEQSQQVFRNCIDKYNHNINFISTGGNIQKVVESLQSRLTIIKMKRLEPAKISSLLNNIIKLEDIDASQNIVDFIGIISNGSLRLQINYLEKFKFMNKTIDLELAKELCCNISYNEFELYTDAILIGDMPGALKLIKSIHDKGHSVMDILDCYFGYIKITDKLYETQKYITIQLISSCIIRFYTQNENSVELSILTFDLIEKLKI